MAKQSNIGWTTSTVNFWSGCTKVSAGCAHCYAETLSRRGLTNGKDGALTYGQFGKGKPRVRHSGAVKNALAMNRKPWICGGCGLAASTAFSGPDPLPCPKCSGLSYHRRRIFSLSLGDWLDEEVPIEWLAEMLDTIRRCDQVIWILCTKRPELWLKRMGDVYAHMMIKMNCETQWLIDWRDGNPPPNICLLTSVENQAMAEQRIPEMLKIPARWRGLSLEPLLGKVELFKVPCLCPLLTDPPTKFDARLGKNGSLDWLIAGGESGPRARACHVEWVRSLIDQGRDAGVATFVKQLGAKPWLRQDEGGDKSRGLELTPLQLTDKKGADPAEWPADLRVQQYPDGF